MRTKEIVILISGLINLTIGASILQSGLKGLFLDYRRYVVGVGCVLFGVLAVYYSDIWKFRKKVDKQ